MASDSTTPHNIAATPTHNQSPISTEINDLLRTLQDNADDDHSNKKRKFVHLSADQFTILMKCFQQQQLDISKLVGATTSSPNQNTSDHSVPSPVSTQTDLSAKAKLNTYYNTAKLEDIICRPIQPAYDGKPDGLIPFLNKLDLRRQDESWSPATYFDHNGKTYDLTKNFTNIDKDVILQAAKTRWDSPTVFQDKITIDHPTYNARCLARVIIGSITDDFSQTIISRIDDNLRHDGPLLLWYICNNIHRNNIAFNETIKAKIRSATLSQFHDDVFKYLSYLRDNLRLIVIADDKNNQHQDLLTYIFESLSACAVPKFKESIQQWHVDYLEAKLNDLSPIELIKMAEDKVQILQHANQWADADTPAVMALKLELQRKDKDQDELVKHIMAHITKVANRHNPRNTPFQYPEWMITPPHSITEIYKNMNGKQYVWCTRCRRGNGLWVCTHTTETHTDGYRRSRTKRYDTVPQQSQYQHQPPYPNGPKLPPSPFPMPPPPQQPHAHLSIADCIDAYFSHEKDTTTTPSENDTALNP
jgi:hypothetical protein